jgi:hypothetical protein
MREYLLVLLFVTASLISYAGSAGAELKARDDKAFVEDGAKQQVTATVVSVGTGNRAINFEEESTPVAVTSATVFDDDGQLDKLKPGTKVNLTPIARADNKAEAVEIRKAG